MDNIRASSVSIMSSLIVINILFNSREGATPPVVITKCGFKRCITFVGVLWEKMCPTALPYVILQFYEYLTSYIHLPTRFIVDFKVLTFFYCNN